MTAEPRFRGEVSRIIDAATTQVFDVLTDLERLPEWNDCIQRVVECPVAVEEGADWLVVMNVPLLPRWKSRSTVIHVDRTNFRFVYRSTREARNPSYIDWFWEAYDRGGRTEVTVRWHGYPLTVFGRRVGAPMRRRQLRHEVATSLEALARASRATGSPKPTNRSRNPSEKRRIPRPVRQVLG